MPNQPAPAQSANTATSAKSGPQSRSRSPGRVAPGPSGASAMVTPSTTATSAAAMPPPAAPISGETSAISASSAESTPTLQIKSTAKTAPGSGTILNSAVASTTASTPTASAQIAALIVFTG